MGSFVLGSTKGEVQDPGQGPQNTEEKAVIKKKPTSSFSRQDSGPQFKSSSSQGAFKTEGQCTRASSCQKPLSWPADPLVPP